MAETFKAGLVTRALMKGMKWNRWTSLGPPRGLARRRQERWRILATSNYESSGSAAFEA